MRVSDIFVAAVFLLTVPSTSGWIWGDKNNKENCQGEDCPKQRQKKQNGNNSNKATHTDDDGTAPLDSSQPVGLASVTEQNGIPMVHLHDDQLMPLVGLGVEYLQPFLVPLMTASALQRDKKTWLFDTAHVTGNEVLLAQGIAQGLQRMNLRADDDELELHVISKVWYTHLGYERTQLSVQESFERLHDAVASYPQVQLKVHMLLQWPRCYETIDWMNCELDEANVGEHVQQAGPPPHEDKENAWKGSWKALEDMYLDPNHKTPLASIGVANFHLKDFQEMDAYGDNNNGIRVHPHILQVSVWSLLYDPLLIDYCTHRGIHLQVVDSIDGILADTSRAPNAHHHLLKVADDLLEGAAPDLVLDRDELTPAQVIYTWLVQQGVSVLPGPERLSQLQDYSATTIAALPQMTHAQMETVAHCTEAFLSGDDLEKDVHTFVTFTAKSKDAMLYWQRPDGSGENKIAFIARGTSFNETTYPKHHFRIYDARNKDNFIDYHVQAKFGEHITFDAYLD